MICVLYSTHDGFALNDGYIDNLSNSPFAWYVKDEYRQDYKKDEFIPEVVHIELRTMKDMSWLSKVFGEIIYTDTTFNDYPMIEIYDDYRE